MTKTLTPLQIELIERHRQRSSGRMTATMGHGRTPPAPSGLAAEWAAQQRQATAEPRAFGGIDVDAIYTQWNAPPTASLREQVERQLHREPQPALIAEEIYSAVERTKAVTPTTTAAPKGAAALRRINNHGPRIEQNHRAK